MHGVRGSLVVALACALMLAGCTDGGSKVAEPSSLPTVSTPGPVKQPGGRRAEGKRPNIVLVLMDDFSMDLLPTMRSAAAMRRDGASYPHSYVADSLCCVSRTSIFTGQYPHQTGVRINSPSSLDPAHPLGGYEAFEAYGNGERTFAVNLQRAGYTTGFVGKFLNRYEYVPGGEVPDPPPGWSDFNVLFGSAYDGWGFSRTYVEDGVVNVSEVPVPLDRRQPGGEGPAVRRHRHPAGGARLHRRPSRRPPAVVPRGRAVRAAQPGPARGGVPGRAALPAGVPRPALPAAPRRELWPPGLPGPGRRGPPGLRGRPRRQRPFLRRRQPGPRCVGAARDLAGAGRARPARPGPDGAVHRPDGPADPASGPAQHLRRAHLRQRLPRRPVRPRGGQGRGVRERHPGPAAGRGSGRPSRASGPRSSPTSTSRRRSRTWPASAPRATGPASRWSRRSTTRPWNGSTTPSSSTPGPERGTTPTSATAPWRWCRRTSPSAAATPC